MHDWFPEKPILRDRLFYFPKRKAGSASCAEARSCSSAGEHLVPVCHQRTLTFLQRMGWSFALFEGAPFVLCYTSAVLAGVNPACKLLN